MAHTDTVNSLNETLTHSPFFVGWRVVTNRQMTVFRAHWFRYFLP
jgi:hypothetical protein